MSRFTKTQEIIRNAPTQKTAAIKKVKGFAKFSNYMVGLDSYGRPLQGNHKFAHKVANTANPFMLLSYAQAKKNAKGTARGSKNIRQANQAYLGSLRRKAEIALLVASAGGSKGASVAAKKAEAANKAKIFSTEGRIAEQALTAQHKAKLAQKAGAVAKQGTTQVGNDFYSSAANQIAKQSEKAAMSATGIGDRTKKLLKYTDIGDDEVDLIDNFFKKRQELKNFDKKSKFKDVYNQFAAENQDKLDDVKLKRTKKYLKNRFEQYQKNIDAPAQVDNTVIEQEERGDKVYEKSFNTKYDSLKNNEMNRYGLVDMYKKGGIVKGKSHSEGGEKAKLGDTNIEVEGGERIFSIEDTNSMDRDAEKGNYSSLGKKYAAAKKKHDTGGIKTKFSGGGKFGFLERTATFESGGSKSKAIGYSRTDGTAYGTIQMSSKEGTPQRFVNFLESSSKPKYKEIAKELRAIKNWDTGSKEGDSVDTWNTVVKKHGMDLYDAEKEFANQEYYEPIAEWFSETYGVNKDKIGDKLKSTLVSRAIQHGVEGSKKVFIRSLPEEGVKDLKESEIITKVYNHVRDNVGGYFSSSSPKVQAQVAKRMDYESASLLADVDFDNEDYADLFGEYEVNQQEIQDRTAEGFSNESNKLKYEAFRNGKLFTNDAIEDYYKDIQAYEDNKNPESVFYRGEKIQELEDQLESLEQYEISVGNQIKTWGDLKKNKFLGLATTANTNIPITEMVLTNEDLVDTREMKNGGDVYKAIRKKRAELTVELSRRDIEKKYNSNIRLIRKGEDALQSVMESEQYKAASPTEQGNIVRNFKQQILDRKKQQQSIRNVQSQTGKWYNNRSDEFYTSNTIDQSELGKAPKIKLQMQGINGGANLYYNQAMDDYEELNEMEVTPFDLGEDFQISETDILAFEKAEEYAGADLQTEFNTKQVEARDEYNRELQAAAVKKMSAKLAETNAKIVAQPEESKTEIDAETEENIDTTLFNDEQIQEYLGRRNDQREATGVKRIYDKFKGTDQVLQMTGMYAAYKSAIEPVPEQKKSQQWKDYMSVMKQRAQSGIAPESKTLLQRQAERTYASDVSNIGRMATSGQAALGALGQAARRKYAADMQMGAQDADLREQHFGEYAKAVGVDENLTQEMWERNEYNEAARKRDLKSGLIGQAVSNIRDDIMFNKQYGDGSQYAQLMQATLDEKRTSERSMMVSQLKTMQDGGMDADQAKSALGIKSK